MNDAGTPSGRDEQRIRRVIEHYETQSDDEAVLEDESAQSDHERAMMEIPTTLVPAVRELLAKQGR